jgi:hypothetical protein
MRNSGTLKQVLLAGSACGALFVAAPVAWSATTSLTTAVGPDVTVDTETATVNGNATPTGFTVPTTGTGVGMYSSTGIYSGDPNNSAVNDQTSRGLSSTPTDSGLMPGGYFRVER